MDTPKVWTIDDFAKQPLVSKHSVLTTGVFDLLHPGHVIFLEKAKALGDMLIVGVESDQKVKESKGQNRPILLQDDRVRLVAALNVVDIVIPLPYLGNEDYFGVCQKVGSKILAVSGDDKFLANKQEVMRKLNGKVVIVTPRLPQYSTTQLVKSVIESHVK